MDVLEKDIAILAQHGSLSRTLDDADTILEQLIAARESIAADPNSAAMTLAKLQNPIKQGFEKVNDDLKRVHGATNKYGKSLNENFPIKAPPKEYNDMSQYPSLINRAIAMHLLREGQFGVAQTFLDEAHENASFLSASSSNGDDLATLQSSELQHKFATMYNILSSLREHNLLPAISWARANSAELERRGSNLEFELSKLQFIWLFLGPSINQLPDDSNNGLSGALAYARDNFGRFQGRFLRDIQQLSAALAYSSNLETSPYRSVFTSVKTNAFPTISHTFTTSYCSLLGLSAESPLYLACTAGAIALPKFNKLESIMRIKRTEWTTEAELPVSIPLPGSMRYHNIFVCPVSKEQTTEKNPPMMMPCGHVVAKESLHKLGKSGRFKCPYCPGESWPKDATEIWL